MLGTWGVFVLGAALLALGSTEANRLLQIRLPKIIVFGWAFLAYAGLSLPQLLSISFPSELVLFLVPLIFCSILFSKPSVAVSESGKYSLFLVYLLLPIALFNKLYWALNEIYAPLLLLGVFVIIWINDTCAYLVGSSVGRNKIWKEVSPNKSWEGFIGGVLGGLIAGYFLANYFSILSPLQGAFLGVWICILATMGDFFESALKRTAGVKDSGNILPGHGGILDRIDSILFVIPGVCAYLLLLDKINF